MSSSWYTNKLRVLAEASITKVEYPGRIVNPSPLLPVRNCSPDFNILMYEKLSKCNCGPTGPTGPTVPTEYLNQSDTFTIGPDTTCSFNDPNDNPKVTRTYIFTSTITRNYTFTLNFPSGRCNLYLSNINTVLNNNDIFDSLINNTCSGPIPSSILDYSNSSISPNVISNVNIPSGSFITILIICYNIGPFTLTVT